MQVLATTFDGASVNRRFVALHNTSDKLVYKLVNLYADEQRYVFTIISRFFVLHYYVYNTVISLVYI